jgi:chromosome partitioning protein
MRKIALINQKGGVGKTTTAVNLGAGLALQGWRVVLVDLDPQANASMHLGVTVDSDEPSTYSVLMGHDALGDALRPTRTLGLQLLPSNIDLSGAELELANAFGRETLLRDAIETWERGHRERAGNLPADFVLFDCPPSLGLLSINGLAVADEVFIALQTEFFALQGMGKLVEVCELLRKRINPALSITGIVPCLYDSRLRLAREVLAEIRKYFPGQVFRRTIGTNVKLAEAPSYGQTIFEYAPDSAGARDYRQLVYEVLGQASGQRFESEEEGEPPADDADEPREPLRTMTPAPRGGTIVRAEDLPSPSPDVFGPRVRDERSAL